MEEKEGQGTENGESAKSPEKNGKSEVHESHKKKNHKKNDEHLEELQKEIEAKDGTIKDLQAKMLYLQAEFENFKKLKIKEKQETLKYGNEQLLLEMIPVLDNLEMALEHASHGDDAKAIGEGVRLTVGQFLKVLEKSGVERIDALNKKFDPNLHEALYQEERDDVDSDTVVSEVQKGYVLNGRVVRPSRVSVSKKPEIQ